MSLLGEQIAVDLNVVASGAITKNRFVARVASPANAVAQATVSGQGVHGVAWAGAATGEGVRLVRLGVVEVESGAAVSAGDVVQTDASGRAITAVSNGVAAGIALEAAGGAAELIKVDLFVSIEGAGGQRMVVGQATPTAGTTTVVTGLTLVTGAVVSLDDDPTVTHLSSTATIGDQAGAPAAGSIILKHWKPTAVDNVTPIAATTPWGEVTWIAVGV
jgi:hypothetical protein